MFSMQQRTYKDILSEIVLSQCNVSVSICCEQRVYRNMPFPLSTQFSEDVQL